MEAPKQPSSSPSVAEQPKIVPKHDDGVEGAEPATDSRDRAQTNIADAAKPTCLDRERRDIDCDDLVTAGLQVQRDPPSPTADIEDPAANQPNRASFNRRPLVEWREVCRSAGGKVEPTIVAFNDLGRPNTIVVREDQLADGVCIRGQHSVLELAV
jgi:hypothetical protein